MLTSRRMDEWTNGRKTGSPYRAMSKTGATKMSCTSIKHAKDIRAIDRMDNLRFYVLFNSILVIPARCLDDNERLCAMELCLCLRRFHLE